MTTPPLATVQKPFVYHVGLLGSGRQPTHHPDSHEGTGLCVSECPEEWTRIAKLGGNPTFRLQRMDGQHGRFVNMGKLSAGARSFLTQQCVDRGDLRPAPLYRVWVYDEDLDTGEEGSGMSYFVFEDRKKAQDTLEGYLEGLDPDEEPDSWTPRLEVVEGWMATGSLQSRWNEVFSTRLKAHNSQEMAWLFWLEDHTDFDGAWWNRRLDPANYLAPSGVIFQSRLGAWHYEKVAEPQRRAS